MANTKLPARLLDTSAIPALNVTGDLTVDTTTLKVDSTNNRVGIGIASPAGLPLQTKVSSGDNKLRMTTASKDAFILELKDASGDVHLGTNTTAGAIVIADGGNVGIGTSSPQRELHVRNSSSGATSTSNSVAVFEGNDNTEVSILGGSSSVLGLNFGHSGDNNDGIITYNTTSGYEQMDLYVNAASRVSIDKDGKVGIGETDPDFKLHVKDTNTQIAIESTTTNQNSSLYYIANGANQWETGVNITAGLDYEIYDRVNNGARMVVQHDGKIRIGNNIPMWSGAYGGALVLKGNNATSDRYAQLTVVDSSGSIAYTGLTVNNTGNVGIGTASPVSTANLQVQDTADSQILIYETGASPYTATLKLASQSTTAYGANVQYTSAAEELTIENFGRALSATSTSGSIRFRTKVGNSSMQEVMRLQGNTGAVTQPYQPTAIYTHVGSTEQGAYGYDYGTNTGSVSVDCKPQSAVVNRGNIYNTSNGRFTAPVAGVYRYGVHGNLYTAGIASNAFWTIRILKNGAHYIYHYESNSSRNSGTWIYVNAGGLVELAANEYITMQLVSNNKAVNNIHFGWDLNYYTHYEFQLLY